MQRKPCLVMCLTIFLCCGCDSSNPTTDTTNRPATGIEDQKPKPLPAPTVDSLIADLRAALKQPESRQRFDAVNAAVASLVAAGSEAVPAIVETLQQDDGIMRRFLIRALGEIGAPHATSAVPVMLSYANVEDIEDDSLAIDELGLVAVRAVLRIGPPDAPIPTDTLIMVLENGWFRAFIREDPIKALVNAYDYGDSPADPSASVSFLLHLVETLEPQEGDTSRLATALANLSQSIRSDSILRIERPKILVERVTTDRATGKRTSQTFDAAAQRLVWDNKVNQLQELVAAIDKALAALDHE